MKRSPDQTISKRAAFIDKDGTLLENVPYNVDPAYIRLTHHAGSALRALSRAGYALIVISNLWMWRCWPRPTRSTTKHEGH